jgi:predicted glycoside hydrolase/deacetylase ChbG (UPF0249 family)
MAVFNNIIANADDFGLRTSISKAILYCFEQEYINSTSIITNGFFFEEAVDMYHTSTSIKNVGVHINLSEGKPVTNFNSKKFLDGNGNWNIKKVNKIYNVLNKEDQAAFSKEIYAQINKAIVNKIPIVHLDSHYHTHTLPCFYKLFLEAAKSFNLKIRLAQTFREDSYMKFYYRRYINNLFRASGKNYSDLFEDVSRFLQHKILNNNQVIEIMMHPDFDDSGVLFDHYHRDIPDFEKNGMKSLKDWICFLDNYSVKK